MCLSVDDVEEEEEEEKQEENEEEKENEKKMEDDVDETYMDHRLETFTLCCTSLSQEDHFVRE